MQKVKGVAIFDAMSILARVSSLIEHDDMTDIIDDKTVSSAKTHAESLLDSMNDIDMPLSKISAKRLKTALEKGGVTFKEIKEFYKEIRSRFDDELDQVGLFTLTSYQMRLYEPERSLFGEDVETKFPDVAGEVEEAGKCLALSRPTASVFHLMRAMEHCVHTIGNELGATTEDKNGKPITWGVILRNIEEKIKKLPKTKESDNWWECYALLSSVNHAWRTNTMHVADQYSEERAKEIFRAVKAFIRYLAPLVK